MPFQSVRFPFQGAGVPRQHLGVPFQDVEVPFNGKRECPLRALECLARM